jgi:hypothetical protein
MQAVTPSPFSAAFHSKFTALDQAEVPNRIHGGCASARLGATYQ